MKLTNFILQRQCSDVLSLLPRSLYALMSWWETIIQSLNKAINWALLWHPKTIIDEWILFCSGRCWEGLTSSRESPVREPLSISPQQGPSGERCLVSRANGLFIHLNLSEYPVKGALPRNAGHRPRNPRRTEGLHTLGCCLVPQADR